MNERPSEFKQPMPPSRQGRRGRWFVRLAAVVAILVFAAGAWWAARVFVLNTGTPGQTANNHIPPGDAPPDTLATADVPSLESIMTSSPVAVLGRMGRATVVDNVPHVRFQVEKVLKGALEEKELHIEDWLPIYREFGPPDEPLSGKFAEGTQVILYLRHHPTKPGALRVEAAKEPSRPFLDIYEIAQGVQPVEKLPDILASAASCDPDVYVAMNLFTNERMAPVLMGVFEADVQSQADSRCMAKSVR